MYIRILGISGLGNNALFPAQCFTGRVATTAGRRIQYDNGYEWIPHNYARSRAYACIAYIPSLLMRNVCLYIGYGFSAALLPSPSPSLSFTYAKLKDQSLVSTQHCLLIETIMHPFWSLLASFSLPLLVSSIPNPPAITARAIASDKIVKLSPSQSSALNAEYAKWTATAGASVAVVSDAYAAPLIPDNSAPSATKILTNGGGPGCWGCSTWLQTDKCPVTIPAICAQLSASANGQGPTDAWVWSGKEAVEDHHGCVMGFWMPKNVLEQKALVPTPEECETNVYGAMAKAGEGGLMGSVNLQQWPDRLGATGEAVDAGRISFLMISQGYDQQGY